MVNNICVKNCQCQFKTCKCVKPPRRWRRSRWRRTCGSGWRRSGRGSSSRGPHRTGSGGGRREETSPCSSESPWTQHSHTWGGGPAMRFYSVRSWQEVIQSDSSLIPLLLYLNFVWKWSISMFDMVMVPPNTIKSPSGLCKLYKPSTVENS